SYPWELLQNSVMDAQPLCVNAGMIRQLSTQDYRLRIKQVTKDNALVVGDPNLNGFIQQLPGAKEEATAVTAMMEEMGYSTQSLINEDATEIIRTLFSDDYKIIHLAGHGIFDEKVPEGSTEKTIIRSGMVIGKDIYLSTREIIQMSTVPELVFVNCCYLGQTVGATEEIYQSRYKLAANIGTQLIENGVKAVVVAGWAVDDAAAMDFTKNFYENMFNGYGFGEAVRRARKLIYDKYQESNNTWGAYQCYGDPYYRIRTNAKKKEEYKCQFVIAQEAEIELKNLTNELETGMYASNEIYGHLEAIAKAVDLAGLRNALITELEALIYAEMGDYDIAIGKLGTLFTMEKASFSVSTLEKYCNLRAKKLVFDFKKQVKGKKYIPEINQVIKELDALLSIGPTAERWSLLGSTCKRKAMLLANMEQKEKAYEEAVTYYRKAYETTGNQYSIYSLTNLLEVESMLVLMG
ncbi:MAG TPA: CHAT domain-containing protein, partial [Flavisolibacter sp.]|nr:CHAT domain-containing protein [Flavisolibacter sp.]